MFPKRKPVIEKGRSWSSSLSESDILKETLLFRFQVGLFPLISTVLKTTRTQLRGSYSTVKLTVRRATC